MRSTDAQERAQDTPTGRTGYVLPGCRAVPPPAPDSASAMVQQTRKVLPSLASRSLLSPWWVACYRRPWDIHAKHQHACACWERTQDACISARELANTYLAARRPGSGGDAKHVRSRRRTSQRPVMAVGATRGDARVNQAQARIGQ